MFCEKYVDKIILAPMVRIGTLPMRLLALDYGADLVYTEELIDHKLIRCNRVENDILGTVDFVDETEGTVVFRTCDKEREKIILQMGTCSRERAIQVGKLVESDVSGIDVNMGCPKEFSIKGGMGSALMDHPEKAYDILKGLTENLKIPVTCKIRVFEDLSKTIEFCKRLEESGISAVAVHGRTKRERPQHLNRNLAIKKIAEALKIPVIANGGSKEITSYEDLKKFKEETGSASVMIARAAEWNCSIFRKQCLLSIDCVIKDYLKYAVLYDNSAANTKYCIQNMLRELQSTTERGRAFLEAQTLEQFCDLWELGEFFRQQKKLDLRGRRKMLSKRFKSNEKIIMDSCCFLRKAFPDDRNLPKQRLLMWTRTKGWNQPVYSTVQKNKLFQSVCVVNEYKYSSSYWEKNKKFAEQAAALVCLLDLGIIERDFLIKIGCIA